MLLEKIVCVNTYVSTVHMLFGHTVITNFTVHVACPTATSDILHVDWSEPSYKPDSKFLGANVWPTISKLGPCVPNCPKEYNDLM